MGFAFAASLIAASLVAAPLFESSAQTHAALGTDAPAPRPRSTESPGCHAAWRELDNGCGVAAFRHLVKTGGTSIRQAIEGRDRRSPCASWPSPAAYTGFLTLGLGLRGLPTPIEKRLGQEWQRQANASAAERQRLNSSMLLTLPCLAERGAASSVYPKMHLESHAETMPYLRFLDKIPRLQLQWPRCAFRVYTLVREPIKRLVSIWAYFGTSFIPRTARNFTEWVGPCLSSGNSSRYCRLQITEAFPHLTAAVSAGEHERVRGWLAREIERGSLFVGTTELFDVSMALLGARWGLPLETTLLSQPSNVVSLGSKRHTAKVLALAELSANPAMHAQLREAFALDYWLHSFASDRLRAGAALQLPPMPVGPGNAAGGQRCLQPGKHLPGTGDGTISALVKELKKQRKTALLLESQNIPHAAPENEPAAMAFFRGKLLAACSAASRVRCAEIGVADETRRGASLNLTYDV
jgi:hypothetical protein